MDIESRFERFRTEATNGFSAPADRPPSRQAAISDGELRVRCFMGLPASGVAANGDRSRSGARDLSRLDVRLGERLGSDEGASGGRELKRPEGRAPGASNRRGGFSLLEMMVAMALLTTIVLGLYLVFDQTQRALRANTAQVDVLENGRTTLDLLSREIEQAVAWGYRDPMNTNWLWPHLWIQAYPTTNNLPMNYLVQRLSDGSWSTNTHQECFFLSRSNNWWVGNGFFLASPTTNFYLSAGPVNESGVGTLYRFSTLALHTNRQANPVTVGPVLRLMATNLFGLTNQFEFVAKRSATNAFPVADGVVHFRLRPYDAWGRMMSNNLTIVTTNIAVTNVTTPYFTNITYYYTNYNIVYGNDVIPHNYRWMFLSNSLPAYLELELGIVQPQVLQRMRAMPTAIAQRNYLQTQAGAVNIFRKLIPLRNAQP